MRLAYVHNIPMPGREANTVNVAKMCNAIAGLGHEVTLIAARGEGRGDFAALLQHHYGLEHRFAAAPLPSYATRPTMASVAGAIAAHRARAELVWTRAPHVALAACAAGLPTVLELHTDVSAFSALGRQAVNAVIRHRNLAGVVVISQALADYFAEQFPGLPTIITAHDGADDYASLAAASKPPGTPLSVGYVGSLYRGKGVELIEAMATRCDDAFTVVGAGGELRTSKQENLSFRGAVPHAEVSQLLSTFDVLIAPYLRQVIAADGHTDTARWMSPLKLFEYMAAQRPIITSDLPVIREILTDNETALLCDPDEPDAWMSAIARLRDDPALRRNLAGRAYAAFTTQHTWRARAAHILAAIAAPASGPALRRGRRQAPAPAATF